MLAGKFSPCNILGSSMFEWHGQVGLNTFMLLTAAGKLMPKNTKVGKGQSPTIKINLVYPASLKIDSSLLYLLSLVVLDKSSKLLQTTRSMPFKPSGL